MFGISVISCLELTWNNCILGDLAKCILQIMLNIMKFKYKMNLEHYSVTLGWRLEMFRNNNSVSKYQYPHPLFTENLSELQHKALSELCCRIVQSEESILGMSFTVELTKTQSLSFCVEWFQIQNDCPTQLNATLDQGLCYLKGNNSGLLTFPA